MHEGESFTALCSLGQIERLKRVVAHHGGELCTCEARGEGIFLTIGKVGGRRFDDELC
jgi:hypothetical protein